MCEYGYSGEQPAESTTAAPAEAETSFELMASDIHVWTLFGAAPHDAIATLAEVLDPQEQARVARLRFRELRESLITSHGVLRFLLGCYLRLDAHKVRFAFGQNGKPRLAPPSRLSFNMAHSGDLRKL